MFARPWLKPDQENWKHLCIWNYYRQLFLENAASYVLLHKASQLFPEIEEARWISSLNLHDCVSVKRVIYDKFISSGNDDRTLTYAAIIIGNNEEISRLAIRGNPIAQYFVACSPWCIDMETMNTEPNIVYWSEKSMAGGYSEGFHRRGLIHHGRREFHEELQCYKKGIELGSLNCIRAYALHPNVSRLNMIYWLSQAWIISRTKNPEFINVCYEWKSRYDSGYNYAGEAFILGSLIDREGHSLIPSLMRNRNRQAENADLLLILQTAYEIHQRMSSKTRKAIETWLKCGLRLGIYRDIRKLISEWLWGTRDDPIWEEGQ